MTSEQNSNLTSNNINDKNTISIENSLSTSEKRLYSELGFSSNDEKINSEIETSDSNSEKINPIIKDAEEKDFTIASTFEDYLMLSKHFYAGFWVRLVAYTIDLIVVLSITGLVNTITLNKLNIELGIPIIGGSITSVLIYFAYFILSTYFFSVTLGKLIMCIKVETNKSKKLSFLDVVFREGIGRLLNMGLLNIPYLAILFNDKKKAVHDFIADTVVVKEDFSKLRMQINQKIVDNK